MKYWIKKLDLPIASKAVRKTNEIFNKKLVNEIEKGEQSGFVKNFDRDKFLKTIHQTHVSK
jgi:antitoxin ParD1/3/4